MSKKKHFKSEEERIEYEKSFYEKKRVDNRKYYQKNSDSINVKNRQNYSENRAEINAIQKKYREENKEKEQLRSKKYRNANKEKIAEKTHENNKTDSMKLQKRKYRIKYKIKLNASRRVRRKERELNDPQWKFMEQFSTSISNTLKRNNGSKEGNSWRDKLPYTKQELIINIESKFEWWMTWENKGPYKLDIWNDNDPSTWTWQMDHIIPKSATPHVSMNNFNFHKCWALDNLYPISSKENMYKTELIPEHWKIKKIELIEKGILIDTSIKLEAGKYFRHKAPLK